jgi:hypothetical protein
VATPARAAPFVVAAVDDDGIVILLGAQETPTRIRWSALEEVVTSIPLDSWMPIGSSYSVAATPGTLDAILKRHVKRATAGWVAAVLEAAGLVEIDRREPTRLRRRPDEET